MNLQHVTHSEDGALIGNHPERSQSVRKMVAEQSATPVRRTSLQHNHKFENRKSMWPESGTQGNVWPKRSAHAECTVRLSWMGPRTFVAVLRKASAVVLFAAYPVGGFPRTLRIGPRPSHHEEQVLFWSEVLLLLLLLVLDLGPGRLIIRGSWLHTRHISICDRHIIMASELHRHDPMCNEQRRPGCSSLARQSAMENMR